MTEGELAVEIQESMERRNQAEDRVHALRRQVETLLSDDNVRKEGQMAYRKASAVFNELVTAAITVANRQLVLDKLWKELHEMQMKGC